MQLSPLQLATIWLDRDARLLSLVILPEHRSGDRKSDPAATNCEDSNDRANCAPTNAAMMIPAEIYLRDYTRQPLFAADLG